MVSLEAPVFQAGDRVRLSFGIGELLPAGTMGMVSDTDGDDVMVAFPILDQRMETGEPQYIEGIDLSGPVPHRNVVPVKANELEFIDSLVKDSH